MDLYLRRGDWHGGFIAGIGDRCILGGFLSGAPGCYPSEWTSATTAGRLQRLRTFGRGIDSDDFLVW